MNKVILMGRLTRDAEVRFSAGNDPMAVARLTLAVDRRKQDAGADFISCIAFKKIAEFMEKYGKKGTKFVIVGHIQTGSYEKDGQKIYTTDVIIDECEFAESKASQSNDSQTTPASGESFMNIPDGVEDEGLPFN